MQKIIQRLKKHSFSKIVKKLDYRYGLGKLELLFACNWFNPFATLYLNLRSFPIKQAFRFPVFVFGHPKFYCLSGKMKVEGKISIGMIKFNKTLPGAPSNMSVQSEIFNLGLLIFRGKGIIGTGTKLFINEPSTLSIGNNFKIADFCNIGCFTNVIIGDQCRISHRCQILDSNYHYVANFNKKIIPRYSHPIILGKGCWICNSSTITGGVILPNFTIVGSNSLVNKDFSTISENSIIAGIPAKFVSSNFRKIETTKIIYTINQYFNSNPTSTYYPLSEELNFDDYSKF